MAGIFVHELGHAIAAIAVGWRVHLIVVLRIGYRPRRRKFQLVSRMVGGDFGGFVLVAPPLDGGWEKGRATIFAAGSLVNLLAALVCYTAILWVDPGTTLGALLGGFALTTLVLGISNLIPSWGQSGVRANDGATLYEIFTGKHMSLAMQVATWLWGSSLDGIAVRDWNPDLLRRLEADEAAGEEDRAVRDHVLVSYYEGRRETGRALSLLENSEAEKSGKHPALTIEKAFLAALVRRDVDLAAQLLDTIPSRLHQSYFPYWRAQSLVYALQGQTKLARSAARRARRLAKTHGDELDDDDESLLCAVESGKAPPLLGYSQPA